MRYACDFGEPGKSTSARTFVNRGSQIMLPARSPTSMDALSSDASRRTGGPSETKLACVSVWLNRLASPAVVRAARRFLAHTWRTSPQESAGKPGHAREAGSADFAGGACRGMPRLPARTHPAPPR